MKRSRAERRKAAKSQHRQRKKQRKVARNDAATPEKPVSSAPVGSSKTESKPKPPGKHSPKVGKKKKSRSSRSKRSGVKQATEEMKAAVELEFKLHKGNLSDWLNSKHPYYRETFYADWICLNKSSKTCYINFDRDRIEEARLKVEKIQYPFESNADDHCETSPTAYKDIVPVLKAVAKEAGRTMETLRIYDPYYCSGAVIRNLGELGFPCVYNRCEDFYKVIKKKKVPLFDVLVTNPPYSETHVKRLLRFCSKQSAPCLLLMPNHIREKPFFNAPEFTLLKPAKRYVYWTPKGLRGKDKQQNHASALGFRTSPYPTSWYCDLKFKHIKLQAMYSGSKEVTIHRSNE